MAWHNSCTSWQLACIACLFVAIGGLGGGLVAAGQLALRSRHAGLDARPLTCLVVNASAASRHKSWVSVTWTTSRGKKVARSTVLDEPARCLARHPLGSEAQCWQHTGDSDKFSFEWVDNTVPALVLLCAGTAVLIALAVNLLVPPVWRWYARSHGPSPAQPYSPLA
eukprot:m51a1_g7496 hypothetical protein (167) ;mRNA; f:258508-259182